MPARAVLPTAMSARIAPASAAGSPGSARAPVSLAQAQTHSHAGMSMQDHAAIQAPASDVTTAPADNAMLAAVISKSLLNINGQQGLILVLYV